MSGEKNLIPFAKGFDPRRNITGPAKTWVGIAKEMGWKKSEVVDCARTLLAMSHDDLIVHEANPNITVLEKIVCKAIQKSLKKGSLYNLNSLLDRIFGKPTENKNIKGEIEIKSVSIEYVQTNVPGATTLVPGEGWQQVEGRIFEEVDVPIKKTPNNSVSF